MPSTLTSDHTTPLTRADLGLWKIDLKRELQQQFRTDMEAVLHSYDHQQQFRVDVEKVLMSYDVRSELRKDLRKEMESVFRERDAQRSERLFRVFMILAGAFFVAMVTASIVMRAVGS